LRDAYHEVPRNQWLGARCVLTGSKRVPSQESTVFGSYFELDVRELNRGDYLSIKDVLASKSLRRFGVITVNFPALHRLKSVFLPQLILNADAECGLGTGIQI
jgi:hypothetical protein